MDKIEKKREFKERQKAIRAHIKETRPMVEAAKTREAYYLQLLAERNERLSKQHELERRRITQQIIIEHQNKMRRETR